MAEENEIPDGPMPGTWAYTARMMAELFPADEEDGYPPVDWDDWKDQMKDAEMGL